MQFPLNLTIGTLEIQSHLIFEILAYMIGFRYYLYLRKKTGDLISDSDRMWIFIGAVAGAFFFSRILGVLENFGTLSGSGVSTAQYLGNKTIVGGLLGGLLGVEITKKIIGVQTSSGDLMTYPVILGMIIGRIGCFLAGVEDGTYGIESSLPWAMDLGDGLLRHPTNLYEIIFLSILWLALSRLEQKFTFSNGSRFKIFIFSYLLFRFIIEFIKPVYTFSLGLSPIQLACLAGIIYYYQVFIYPKKLVEKIDA
jgi:phosphatidylglycerol:prolipoprotein diacylglycerol transferase